MVPAVTPASPTVEAPTSMVDAAGVPGLAAPYTLRWRMGGAIPDGHSPHSLAWPAHRPGWYLNWSVGFTQTTWSTLVAAPLPQTQTPGRTFIFDPEQIDEASRLVEFVIPADAEVGMEFAPMVRVNGAEISPDPFWLAATVARLPGRTWLIGNEPDVKWQDNATPTEYAQAYQLAYTTIKGADPAAQVAIGGLSQITPLRLAYLDAVWAEYQRLYGVEMPVDVWTMHAFVLQERRDDWGVDIPPGMDPAVAAALGVEWTLEQHDDLALVEGQIRHMRAWMADHGQQAKPLWITEYGVLMPGEYGFDLERVRRFMLGSFELFLWLQDPALGYGPDGGRLVQRWMWFSTGYPRYPMGDLFTPQGQPTGLMAAMAAYLAEFDDAADDNRP